MHFFSQAIESLTKYRSTKDRYYRPPTIFTLPYRQGFFRLTNAISGARSNKQYKSRVVTEMVGKDLVSRLSNAPIASDYLDALRLMKEENIGVFDEDTGEIAYSDGTGHCRMFVTFGQDNTQMRYVLYHDLSLL